MGLRHYFPLRWHHDIPIRRREEVPLRRLGDFLVKCRWMFRLRRTCDAAETYKETSLQRLHDLPVAWWDCNLLFLLLEDNKLSVMFYHLHFQKIIQKVCLLLENLD